MLPTSRCVILVPIGGAIEPDCDDALRQLERRSHPVWRVRGYAAIDAARNQMATDALAQGFDELMWIDSDVVFGVKDSLIHELTRREAGAKAGGRATREPYAVMTYDFALAPGGQFLLIANQRSEDLTVLDEAGAPAAPRSRVALPGAAFVHIAAPL